MTTAGPTTATILFSDLVNSTELLQRVGDETTQRVFETHHRPMRGTVAAHGGAERYIHPGVEHSGWRAGMTMREGWPRWRAGAAAIMGALVGIALTPVMASVWAYDDNTPWAETTRLERSVGPTLETWGLLDFGGDGVPYQVYGKAFFLVYALMIPAVQWMRPASIGNRKPGKVMFWLWRVMFGALCVAGTGDFVAYWGSLLPGIAGDGVSRVGFTFEFFAMPILLLASAAFGLASLRSDALPRWVGGALALAPASAIATALLLTNYVPNAAIVPLSLIWAVIGAWLWMTDRASNTDAWRQSYA